MTKALPNRRFHKFKSKLTVMERPQAYGWLLDIRFMYTTSSEATPILHDD